MGWILFIIGAVSAFFSTRHLWTRHKAEENGDTSYRQGFKPWLIEVAWLIGSYLLLLTGPMLMFVKK